MHVVLFSPAWPPESNANGIITYCALMRDALIVAGHEVSIIAGHVTEGYDDPDCHQAVPKLSAVDKLWMKINDVIRPNYRYYYLGYQGALETLRALHKKKPIDIFEIEESYGWHYPIAKQSPFPVVMRLHGPHFLNGQFTQESDKANKTRIDLERHAIRAAKYITAPSRDVLDRVVLEYRPKPKFHSVIYNPAPQIDAEERWSPDLCDINELVFIGRFDDHKGGDIVLKAFERVSQDFPNARLTFVGPDVGVSLGQSDKKINFADFLTQEIDAACHRHIHYLGRLKYEELIAYRKKAAIVLIASRYDNFPNTALEAVAMGVPTVCSDGGGMKEIIVNERNGLSFPTGDAEAMAHCIKKLLSDRVLANTLADNAVHDAHSIFASVKLADDTLEFYQLVTRDFFKK